jgi:acetyl-CoA carboxylase biotin carboxyl carrier protein
MTQSKKRPAIDLDVIRELAQVLAEASLSEIEYETGDCRVRVSRIVSAAPAAAAAVAISPSPVGAPAGETHEADSFAGHPGLLTSPMVGIAYVAPEPGAPPFVKPGDPVAVGDTVMLIEAMKVFNPIKAHRNGRIERIFVDGGVPVEYGEPLLLIV